MESSKMSGVSQRTWTGFVYCIRVSEAVEQKWNEKIHPPFDACGKSLWILLALREESLESHCIVEVGFRGGKIKYAASLSVVDGSEGKGPE